MKGSLPPRMKVLYITTLNRTGGWLAEAFAADSATQILLEEVVGVTSALAKLRDEVFDAVIVSHEPPVLDALDLVEGLRAGGNEEPMILLGSQRPHEIDALCYEVGADDYCCVAETTVRGLLWKFARAIERHQLQRENRRMVQADRQRLKQEHLEAQRLLEQQRLLIADLEVLKNPTATSEQGDVLTEFDDCLAKAATAAVDVPLNLPEPLVNHYRELLRTYVIMGVGNLTNEMAELSELLAASEVSAQRALQLHVTVLEDLVQGLGSRSARHVMNRADLLVLEVMGHLADGYRQRYFERRNPPRQKSLPGFDSGSAIRVAA
ncbi:PleD family two-component system response regulator [Bythopirellula goksoeyrii]|nr:response regulator transcription factor [Bythopirellula goksoeyrii]